MSDPGTGTTDAALRAAFGFTEADVAENRAGRMSAGQRARMTTGRKRANIANIIVPVVVVIFMVVVIVVFVLPGVTAPTSSTSSAVPPWVIGLVVVVVALIILISFLRTRRRLAGLTGALHTVEGEANPSARTMGNVDQLGVMPVYRLKLGGVTFALSTALQLAAFQKGTRYRVYYAQGTLPIILAAEQLP